MVAPARKDYSPPSRHPPKPTRMGGHRFPAVVAALLLYLLTTLSVSAAGDAEITLKLEKTGIEMGRVFLGQLLYNGKSGTGPADLLPWEKNFFVERANFSIQRKNGRIYSSEDIRLYPRRSGSLVINAIAHGGVIMEPVTVQVKPLIRNGIPGDPVLKPLPRRVQVGSPLEITVEVPLLHPSNKVVTAPWKVPGARVVSLPQETIETKDHTAVLLHWKVFARQAGDYQLDLPAIYQRGNGKWRFHLPLQTVEFFPLPSYLPPTLPVGRLAITSDIITINSQQYWRVRTENSGLLTDEIYGLRSALAKTANLAESDITILPPTTLPSGGQAVIYRLPIPQWTVNIRRGPSFKQLYYDPETESLETVLHELPAARRLPLWANLVAILLALPVIAIVFIGLYRLGLRVRDWLDYRRRIRRCHTPHALRQLLLEHGGYKTLEQWAGARGSLHATVIAHDLNSLCFRGTETPGDHSGTTTAGLDTLKSRIAGLRPRITIIPSALLKNPAVTSGIMAKITSKGLRHP